MTGPGIEVHRGKRPEAEAPSGSTPGAPSVPWYRQRSVRAAALSIAASTAALTAYLTIPKRDRSVRVETVGVKLAPQRPIEARVAWRAAAPHRPYNVQRADEAPRENIALADLAAAEARRDFHGVAALALLNGDRRQAASYLDRAGDGVDVMADRAALALGDGQPMLALGYADAALSRDADHAPATWNRALALRDLGLARSAAEAFRAVAEAGEPGWAEEARQRAAALDAETDRRQARAERINRAGPPLTRGQLELAVDDATAQPGFARIVMYDAIRSAPSAQRLAALRPLAAAIDRSDGDTAMSAAIDRAASALRPALATRYGEIVRAIAVADGIVAASGDEIELPTGAARAAFLAELRAARADDLLIGALIKLSADHRTVDAAELPEFVRLTGRSVDPWMQLLGIEQEGLALNQRDELVGAEAVLLRGRARCAQGGAAYRCVKIAQLLGDVYLKWQRVSDARTVLHDGFGLARRSGEWYLEMSFLPLLAELAVVGDEVEANGLPLARGYTDERVARLPVSAAEYRCQNAEWGRTRRAVMLINQLRFDDARLEMIGPRCEASSDPWLQIFVRSELLRDVATPAELASLRADIAALRASGRSSPAEAALLDHAEGRVLIDREPAVAEPLLRRAIAAVRAAPTELAGARTAMALSHKAAAVSYSVLALAAARRDDGAGALALLAEEQALAVPPRCALGLVVEDQRRAMIARGAGGEFVTHYDEARTKTTIDPTALVPARVAAAVRGCPVVDVIARPPLHGLPRLLDDAIAWRYLTRRERPVAPVSGESVVIADVEPPAALGLSRLTSWASRGQVLSGPRATPSTVLETIGRARDAIVHAHGVLDGAEPDSSFLALSAGADGRYALTAGEVRTARFTSSPLVILAACRAARSAPVWHETWSLPAAFIYAGARAVLASASPIPDIDAGEFFDRVRAASSGRPLAIELRDARQKWLAEGRGDWVRDVIVFE